MGKVQDVVCINRIVEVYLFIFLSVLFNTE